MQVNWKLILFDIILLFLVGFIIYGWSDRDNFHKFLDIIMVVILFVSQIDRHTSFYKKKKGFIDAQTIIRKSKCGRHPWL